MNTIEPNIPIPTRKSAAMETEKMRFEKTERGRMGSSEPAAEQPWPGAAPRGRIETPPPREGVREDRAPAEPLDRAEQDELEHVLRDPREHRSHEEENDRGQDERLPAMDVGELAVD